MTGGRSVNDAMPKLTVLASVVLGLAVLGCSEAGSPSAVSGPVDATGSWQLTGGQTDGIALALAPDFPISMTVDGSQVSGRSACNSYSGEIVVDGGRVRFSQTSMTQMACQDPVMAAESAFFAAMGRIGAASLDGGGLVLSGPGVRLEFERLAPPPVADMVGTDWILKSLVKGDVVSNVAGAPATLRFDPGRTFSGSTGCRTFKGKWVAADGGIATPELGMDGECPADLAAQDSQVVSVIEGFRASVDGETLTLEASGGEGLIYLAAE
jgi:heat shock protein HslJ